MIDLSFNLQSLVAGIICVLRRHLCLLRQQFIELALLVHKLVIHLLKLVSHADAPIDELGEILIKGWKVPQFLIKMVKNACVEICLHVVLHGLLHVVHAEQRLRTVWQEGSDVVLIDLVDGLLGVMCGRW